MDIVKKKLRYEFINSEITYENTLQSNVDMPIFHFHDNYEIYYISFGERNFFIGDKVYRAKKGDIILIKSNILHRNTAVGSNGYERIIFYVQRALLDKLDAQYKSLNLYNIFNGESCVLRLNKMEQKYIEDMLMRVVNYSISDEEVYKAYGDAVVSELLLFLQMCIKNGEAFIPNYINKDYEKISPIVTYINSNYKNDMLLNSIADEFYTSISCLTKSFKRATGLTINNYINLYRIQIAKGMLKGSTLNITQVADSVGFNNVNHFSRTFGKIVGTSPLKFKNASLTLRKRKDYKVAFWENSKIQNDAKSPNS